VSQVFTLDRKQKVRGTSRMRNQRWRDAGFGKFRIAVLCVLCLGIARASATAPAPPDARHTRQQVEVLFLSSLDPDLPDVAAMIEQAETRILNGSDRPVHFGFEYLQSSASLSDPSRAKATVSYLLEKYRGETFDLVIAINEETVGLAEQIQAKLSPDAALLFFVVNPKDPSSWLNQKPGRTGIIREVNYLPTLQLALQQNPGTSHVVVVSGSSEAEKLDVKLAKEQFREYESNLEIQYLTELPFSELGPRLEHVPSDGIVVFLDFITDSHGEQFIPSRILPSIAKTANRPIYGTFSSVVGGGAVGGSVADLGDVGQILGNDGVRILKGENPQKIAVTTGNFQHYVVDWRQLHRWGFSENQLPKGTEVRNWEYSPWELYRWRIIGLSTILLIETLLIVLLLRSIANRKRAQQKLRQKDEELAEAQRLARLGSWFWDAKKKALTWSEELYRIHGLDPGLPLPSYDEFAKLFTPESWDRLRTAIDAALQTGSVRELDLELVRTDGGNRWVNARGEAVRDTTGQVKYLRGTVLDITESKLAAEVLSSVGRKLIEAQEEERRRIARELHDDINQRMALLANGLQELGLTTSSRDLVQKEELQNLWKVTNEIATDIEQVSHQLHPSKLLYLGLAAAVRDICHESSRQHKIEIECVVRGLPENLEEGTALSLFRTVQESLRNVAKHSHAHHVKVELTRRSNTIQLRVTDDGAGFETDSVENNRGLGLISMRERLRCVGGEFSIWSKPSQGTKVEADVPITLKSRRAEEPTPEKMAPRHPSPPVNSDSGGG
jgi:PAS domain S-box-containing protein